MTRQQKEIRRRWEAGETAGVIAAHFGFTRNKVADIVSRMGLKRTQPAKLTLPYPGRPANIARRTDRPSVGRKPPSKPVEHVPAIQGPAVQLMALTTFHCRWPIGDPSDASFGFCGQPKALSKSYCPACQRLAYVVSKVRAA